MASNEVTHPLQELNDGISSWKDDDDDEETSGSSDWPRG